MKIQALVCLSALVVFNVVYANDYSYSAVADRYQDSALDDKTVQEAKMQGECLVGLKELNFKKKDKFDPIAEWTNYRSVSLLQQYPPCEVLIMMEFAKSKISLNEEGD